jgi:hypothetical protein
MTQNVHAELPVYSTSKDGITVVDVYSIPFDVTITENGSVTIHNGDSEDHIVSHTGTTGTTHSGTFYKVIPASEEVTIDFPIAGNTIYQSGVYYFEDTTTGKSGSITIVPWTGSEQIIAQNTVTGITQGITEDVGIQESIVVILESQVDENTKPNVPSELDSAPTVIADYTVISLQNELVQSETKLTETIKNYALLKNELNTLQETNSFQKQEIVKLTSEIEKSISVKQEAALNDSISELETQVTSLQKENSSLVIQRDQWKQLSDNWYAVAQQQIRVMIEVLGL